MPSPFMFDSGFPRTDSIVHHIRRLRLHPHYACLLLLCTTFEAWNCLHTVITSIFSLGGSEIPVISTHLFGFVVQVTLRGFLSPAKFRVIVLCERPRSLLTPTKSEDYHGLFLCEPLRQSLVLVPISQA